MRYVQEQFKVTVEYSTKTNSMQLSMLLAGKLLMSLAVNIGKLCVLIA